MPPSSLLRALVTAGVIAAAASGVPARAQEAPAADAETAGISWVDGWESGRAAARERDRLMLVYVHRTSPP